MLLLIEFCYHLINIHYEQKNKMLQINRKKKLIELLKMNAHQPEPDLAAAPSKIPGYLVPVSIVAGNQ